MKNKLNPHNPFNNDSHAVRRWKFFFSIDLLEKGERPIPLFRNGKISPIYNEDMSLTEKILKKWFFKIGFDLGVKINGRLFHLMPNEKFNKAFANTLTRFNMYEVKNEVI